MQLVSGMSLPAYWVSNYVADIIKSYIPITLIVALSYLFSCDYPGCTTLFFMLPLALVPFTYVTSFLFKSETSSQITTLFFHFCVAGIIGPMGFFLQGVP